MIIFILLVAIFAVLKFNRPGLENTPTPTPGQPPLAYYYLETNSERSESHLMRSTVLSPESSEPLVTISHAPGSQPSGSLSPDGNRIALLVAAPGSQPDGDNTFSGDVWLFNVDDNSFQEIISGPVTWFAWRQDGSALAYFTREQSPDGTSWNTSLYKHNLATGARTLLEEENNVMQTMPLGWASGGEEIVLIGLNPNGRWSVYSLKTEVGVRVERITLVEGDLLRNAWLGPNGAYLLIDLVREQEALLFLYSLDGKQRTTLTSVGIGQSTNPPAYNPIWSADGKSILVNQPAASLTETIWKTYQVNGTSGTPFYLGEVDPTHYLRPLDWSSDGRWLAMIESPYPSTHLYIKEITASERARVILQDQDDQAVWIGFSTNP